MPAAVAGVRGYGSASTFMGRAKFVYMKCSAGAAAWFSTFLELRLVWPDA
jgi:hypothetical protein